jgi:hypothetical protein
LSRILVNDVNTRPCQGNACWVLVNELQALSWDGHARSVVVPRRWQDWVLSRSGVTTRGTLGTLPRLETCPWKTGAGRGHAISTLERGEKHLRGGEKERRGGERERREGELLRPAGRGPWSRDRIWSGVLRRCCANTTSICAIQSASERVGASFLKQRLKPV